MPFNRNTLARSLTLSTLVLLAACSGFGGSKSANTDAAATDSSDTAEPGQDISIRIEGVSNALLENVNAALRLNRQKNDPGMTESRLRYLHANAEADIRTALKVFGYYTPEIDSELKQRDDGSWQARYQITPGEPVRIGSVDISITGEGADKDIFTSIRADHPFEPASVLEHASYNAYKARFERSARENGYFEARFTRHEMRVDVAAGLADIRLEFATGPRYRFGPVHFSETPFRDDFLRNYIPFADNAPYSARDTVRLRQRLIDSDLFSSVEVRTREEAPENDTTTETVTVPAGTESEQDEVPLAVRLETRKPNRFTAGAGFATDTGPRIRLGWDARYLNDRGHSLNTDLRGSLVTSSLTSTYLMPFFLNRQADVGVSASLQNEDTDSRVSRSGQTRLFHSQERWGWQETLSLGYLFENFEVAQTRRSSKLLMPGVSWRRSWADDPIHAQRGGRVSLEFRGASESVASDVSMAQTRIQMNIAYGLGWRNRLLARLDLGATAVSDFAALPGSLRFFAGGDNSIRGFDYEALGPKDETGRVIGGRYLMVGSFEYEQLVYGNWGAAAFVDFGNAFNDLSSAEIEVGTGVGLRWLSPIGLIRLDIARDISSDDPSFRLHFGFGTDF